MKISLSKWWNPFTWGSHITIRKYDPNNESPESSLEEAISWVEEIGSKDSDEGSKSKMV